MPLKHLAWLLISSGALLLLAGCVLLLAAKFGIPLGRLPGDIHVEGKHGAFSFPVVTCLILSLLLTLMLNLFLRR